MITINRKHHRAHRPSCRYARGETIEGIGGIDRVITFLRLIPCKVCKP